MRHMEVLGVNGLALRAPDYVDTRVFAAATAEAHAVPTGGVYVVFKANVDFYVRYNAAASGTAAAVPAADVTDGSGCEMNPAIRFIGGIAELSIIPSGAGIVTMAFYKA